MSQGTAKPGMPELLTAVQVLTAKVEAFEKKAGTPADGNDAVTKAYATARDPRAEKAYGYDTPAQFLLDVMKVYQDGEVTKRLAPLVVKNIQKNLREQGIVTKAVGSDEQSGINDPYGGIMVPPAFAPDLLKLDPETDPLNNRVRRVPMTNPMVTFKARTDKNHTTSVSGGLTVARKPETVAGTSSRMELEDVSLRATTLFGVAYATEEILSDSPISFATMLADGFADQFAYHLMKERISGTGTGEFEGVLNAPCLVTVDAEAGQEADTITYRNVIDMRSRCWGYSKAVWLANHDTAPQLMLLNQQVGTGGAVVWQPSAREDHPDMLLGRPLIFSEYAKKLGDAGDLILGNWNEYLEGTYQPLQNAESIHVRFINHERAFKFWTRNDARTWWRSALTTVNSSATLSPFVVLEAR